MKIKDLKNIIPIFVLLFSFNLIAQKDTTYTFGDDPGDIEYFFGFNLTPNAMGGMVNFALVKPGDNGIRIIKQITQESFIVQALGKEQSWANPKAVNFFKQYQIDNPNILGELWRLRYKEYPYLTREQMQPGWSTNDSVPFLPSGTQMKMLEKFGLFKLSDYIYGDNAFKLLYLMEKPEWIKAYKESY